MLRASSKRFEKAKLYTYTSSPTTAFDRLLNPFWNFVAQHTPEILHPNVISLIAWLFSVASFVLVLIDAPSLSEGVSSLYSFAIALFVFLYQTFDAVDGKHARRTNRATPLGTIFDHGLDITTATMLGLIAYAFFSLPMTPMRYFSVVISSQVSQFVTLWYEHHHHLFRSNPGIPAGVTEIQLVVILIAILNGLFGPGIYNYNFISGISLSNVSVLFLIVLNTTIVGFWSVQGLFKLKGTGRLLRGIMQLFRIALYIVLQWYFIDEYDVLKAPKILCHILCVAAYGLLALRLLLCNVTRQEYSFFQPPLLPFETLCAILFLQKHFMFILSDTLLGLIFAATFVFTLVFFFVSAASSVVGLAEALDVPVFTTAQKVTKLQ